MNIEGIGAGVARAETPAPARSPLQQAAGDLGDDVQRLLHPHDAGDFLHGLFGLPGAAVQTLTGAAGDGLALAGHWLDEPSGTGHLGEAGARLAAMGVRLGQAADRLGRALEALTHGRVDQFASGATEAIGEGVASVEQLGAVIESVARGESA